jgi:hypothetical protein
LKNFGITKVTSPGHIIFPGDKVSINMEGILIKKLLEFISENNPELLFQLEEDGKVAKYLSNKIHMLGNLVNNDQPEYIVLDICMDLLTHDLRPSRYNYICTTLEEEFPAIHQQLQKVGILKFEVINLVSQCYSVFTTLSLSEENESDRFLRYAIIAAIGEYFNTVTRENENVKIELQQSPETTG